MILRFLKTVFIMSLSYYVNQIQKNVKCIPLDNQPYLANGTLVDLNPSELRYYPFAVSLDRYSGSCKGFDNLLDRLCVSNKTDVNQKVFNMITVINE